MAVAAVTAAAEGAVPMAGEAAVSEAVAASMVVDQAAEALLTVMVA
jgi:hypothetical protein